MVYTSNRSTPTSYVCQYWCYRAVNTAFILSRFRAFWTKWDDLFGRPASMTRHCHRLCPPMMYGRTTMTSGRMMTAGRAMTAARRCFVVRVRLCSRVSCVWCFVSSATIDANALERVCETTEMYSIENRFFIEFLLGAMSRKGTRW